MYVPPHTHTPSQAPPSGSLELSLGTSLFWAGKGKAGPRSHPLPDPTPSEKEGRKARTPGSSCQNRWSGGELPCLPHQKRSRWTWSHLK